VYVSRKRPRVVVIKTKIAVKIKDPQLESGGKKSVLTPSLRNNPKSREAAMTENRRHSVRDMVLLP
jgi:hypothetical protein